MLAYYTGTARWPEDYRHQRYRDFYQLYRSIYRHIWDDWELRLRLLKQ